MSLVTDAPRNRDLRGILGRPAAFVTTALVILAVFGGTFVLHPGRSAPTRDPAYYTWRTEALLTEEPATLLEIKGPFGMYSGGYRVSVPVLGGLLRRVGDVAPESSAALLMVIVPVLISLLLAGFAYRHVRDPVIWHSVAFASAGMMLTPPFVGYLDNLLVMFFLAGALWFLRPSRDSWAGRVGLFLFLLVAGVTHTTTLAIFGLTLGAMAFARLLFARVEVPGVKARVGHVLSADGPSLLTAFVAAIVTAVIWQFGIWGEPASLGESALVFPYDRDFFMARLDQWVDAMRPLVNGPLLAAGIVGLLAVGRRWVDNELTRVSIVWLAPLVGTFGFLAGLEYPYFRFFNTTLAWVLLVGVGAYVAITFFERLTTSRSPVAALGIVAIAVVLITNISSGLQASGWSDPDRGWLTQQKRLNLDLLRANLQAMGDFDRPVVFISDARPPEVDTLAQVWGITQLNGNTSRYGLPPGQIDRGYIYQGDLLEFLADRPTVTGNDAYDDLSLEALEDTRAGLEDAGQEPLIVVASVFNEVGPNIDLFSGPSATEEALLGSEDIWLLDQGQLTVLGGDTQPVYTDAADIPPPPDEPGPLHLAWVVFAFALLVIPGVIAERGLVAGFPGSAFPDLLAMGPAAAVVLLVLSTTLVLGIAREPLSVTLAWISWLLALVAGVVVAGFGQRHLAAKG